MYNRYQVIDSETGAAVCAVVAPAHVVTQATLKQWAEAIANSADKLTGNAGLHVLQPMQRMANERAALGKLLKMPGGHGGNYGVKPRGVCRHCGREYPLNKHGFVSVHGKKYGTKTGKRCAGSNVRPAAVTKAAGAIGGLQTVAGG